MESINDIQDQIIEEFASLGDWMDRYNYLIEIGNELPPMDEKLKTEKNLIDGCQSRVWITATLTDGRIHFEGESDAILVKGLVALLFRVLNDQTPKDIAQADLYFIDRIGMKENLSPTRANGLISMIKQIKYFALAFEQLDKKE